MRMTYLLDRPAARFEPAKGLLLAEHFQMAYATNDLDRACDLLGRQLGIREFGEIGGETASGGQIRVKLAWVGSIMYELMWAEGPGSELYNARLPADDSFALVHHHLGYLIHDEAQWQGVFDQAEANGWAVPYRSANAGFLQACFVDVPQLGHYLEFIFPEPAGIAFFGGLPRH